MLTAYVLQAHLPRPDRYPPLGPALHAVFFEIISRFDHRVANCLHDYGPEKPFALSELIRDAEGRVVWRWVALDRWTAEDMARAIQPPPDRVYVAGMRLGLSLLPDHPWSERIAYEALEAEVLSGEPLWRHDLLFPSLTAFRREGAYLAEPDPTLMLASWLRRWNLFSDRPLPTDWLQQVPRYVSVEPVRLDRRREQAGRMRIEGFTGSLQLRVAPHAPEALARIVHLMVRYAHFVGTGAKTTQGYGLTLHRGSYPAERQAPVLPAPPPILPVDLPGVERVSLALD